VVGFQGSGDLASGDLVIRDTLQAFSENKVMGWKTVKEWLGVTGAVVHVQDGILSIGTPGIPVLVQVGKDGQVVRDPKAVGSASQLGRAIRKIGADKAGFMEALAAEDQFEVSTKVYTYNLETGKVEEHQSEKPGYPNVTHSGVLMYDDLFFSDPEQARLRGMEEEEELIERYQAEKEQAEKALEQAKALLKRAQAHLRDLKKGEPKQAAAEDSPSPSEQ
jgi:hypothetical protein